MKTDMKKLLYRKLLEAIEEHKIEGRFSTVIKELRIVILQDNYIESTLIRPLETNNVRKRSFLKFNFTPRMIRMLKKIDKQFTTTNQLILASEQTKELIAQEADIIAKTVYLLNKGKLSKALKKNKKNAMSKANKEEQEIYEKLTHSLEKALLENVGERND